MNRKLSCVKGCLFFLLALVSISCDDDTLKIVGNAKSDYEIVCMGTASESKYKSAETLQLYIDKISGVKLDIVDEGSQNAAKHKIYIGTIRDENLDTQQIAINTEKENLFISGGSDKAIENAVYEFLEKFLDCRWYAPGVAKIPSSKEISLSPIHYRFTPEINTRTVHSRLFYDHKDYADQQKVTYEAFPKYAPTARVHTFHKFLPEEKFYASHPEFYALRGKKRLPTQLCLTNEKVLEIVKDSVSTLFKRHPEASVVSVVKMTTNNIASVTIAAKSIRRKGVRPAR